MADFSYGEVLDFTSGAQQQERERTARRSFSTQVATLPEATRQSLPPELRQALGRSGWSELMPVQACAIPHLLEGRDVIVQSRTGSGKTGAFLLPLFRALNAEEPDVQALVLTPTRELARQVYAEFCRLASGMDLRASAVYGGVGYDRQTRELAVGAQVVVGTPGRVLDLLQRRTFVLDKLRVFILDEADEMLSMGFYPDMMRLKQYLPSARQSCMFSATMPPKVRALGQEFLDAPSFLGLSSDSIGVETIAHRCYRVPRMEKDRVLARLLELENADSALIFANTKREVEYLAQFLHNSGFDVAELTGNLAQKRREAVLARFRRGELRYLIATDVAARGIDIIELSHVFQYDVPQDPEYYIHRTGRTARAGRAGTAIVLATIEDERELLSIAARYEIELVQKSMPTEEDVTKRASERFVVQLEKQLRSRTNLERERLKRLVPLVRELADEVPELLAMLVDEQYRKGTNPRGDKAPKHRGKKAGKRTRPQ